MATISASVGNGGVNKEADVRAVQTLLNRYLIQGDQQPEPVTGTLSVHTLILIEDYQAKAVGLANPDGLISPGGKTIQALDAGKSLAPLGGTAWWHANEAKYPNSARLADLAKPFRDNAIGFIDAMRAGGATITVSATLRNATRAWLMHHSWKVAKGLIAPDLVPVKKGCPIGWDHGDPAKSKKAAQEMVDLFDIAFQPSLTSRHIEGRAVDMTIAWTGTLKIKGADGKEVKLDAPRSGETNTGLHKAGAGYGVVKLVSDPPHWSDDGH